MGKYIKWIQFTKVPIFEDAYVKIGTKKLGSYTDRLALRDDIIIRSIFPCTDKKVTLRIYWSEK